MILYIDGPDAGIDFLVDSLSIIDLASNNEAEPITTDQMLQSQQGCNETRSILLNSCFEEQLDDNNWVCNSGCTGTLVEDSHSGNKSYLASSRYVPSID